MASAALPAPIVGWTAFGTIVAVAMVLAAVALRPDPVALAPATQVAMIPNAALTDAAEPSLDAPPGMQAGSAAVLPAAIRVRVGPNLPADRRAEIVVLLKASGYAVEIDPLPFSISRSRVGYYRPEDRDAAEEVARLVAPVAPDIAGDNAVRDYSEYLSDAAPGRLDVWIGG